MKKSVALLTISGIVVKICGLLFKIPLVSVIGDEGMGYFNSAYVIYNFFFVLSTSGLPVALSILVSSSKNEKEARQYFKTGLSLYGGFGLILCLLMLFFPKRLGEVASNPNAFQSIAVMGPTLLFVCLIGAFRGYFQGKKEMLPTAVSQMTESVFKVGIGLFLPYFLLKIGYDRATAAAGALFGITVGSLLAFLYLLILYFKKRTPCQHEEVQKTRKEIIKKFVSVAMPVTAASSVLSFSSLLDLALIMKKLRDMGYDDIAANTLYGNYSGLALPLFTLPSVFIAPMIASSIPYLSDAIAKKDTVLENSLCKGIMEFASAVAAPAFFGLLFLAKPILLMLFPKASAEAAAPLLMLLAPSSYLVALSGITGAFLQGSGYTRLPVYALFSGGVIKIVSTYLLMDSFEMAGAPIGTFCCYTFVLLLQFLFCKRKLHFRLSCYRTFFVPLLSGACCGIFAKWMYTLLLPHLSQKIACLFSIALSAVIYGFSYLLLGGGTGEWMGNFCHLNKKIKDKIYGKKGLYQGSVFF